MMANGELMNMWMQGIISSDDLEKEIKDHLDMLHEYTLEKLKKT